MVDFKTNKAYIPYFDNRSRNLLLYGGAGSGKSWFAGTKFIRRCLFEENNRFLLLRKVQKTIRNSQYSLLKDVVNTHGLREHFEFKDSMMEIIGPNGNMFVAAGLDDPEKLKSIHKITSTWIEEATELSYRDYLQVDLRLRGKQKATYKQHVLTFNPVDSMHWINKHFFQGVVTNKTILKTTYLDNGMLDKAYKQTLIDLASVDPTFYKIYTLGEWATPENLIFNFTTYSGDAPKLEPIYGIDFGFAVPTAVVKCVIEPSPNGRHKLYLDELLYETKITNTDLLNLLPTLIPNKNSFIYADAAEPDRIEEIYRAGWNIHAADKGQGSVKAGIDYIRGHFEILVQEYANNIIKEMQCYKRKEDKDGNIFDEPVKLNDHLMDAIRYAVYTYCKKYLMASDMSFPLDTFASGSGRRRRSSIDFSNYNTYSSRRYK